MTEVTHAFIINIDPHPALGMQGSVWVSPLLEGQPSLAEARLTPASAPGYGLEAGHPLVRLVEDAEIWTEKAVLAHFNRQKRGPKSLEELAADPDRKKALQSYANRKVSDWLTRAVATGCRLCSGLNRNGMIHSQEIAWVPVSEAPLLTFDREAEGIRYRLELRTGKGPFPLLGKTLHALAGPDGWALLERWLIRLEGAPATVLKPFTEKEEVLIPEKHVRTYMRAFILPMAEKAEVHARGFRIIEHGAITEPRLGVIQDIFSDQWYCRLAFRYGDVWFPAYESRMGRQRLAEEQGGEFVIHRYLRDLPAEKQWTDSLESLGLIRSSAGALTFADLAEGADLGTAAGWLIRQMPALRAAGWHLEPLHAPQGQLLLEAARIEEAELLEGPDWFDLHARVLIGEDSLPLTALADTITGQVPFHPLPGGRCFRVPDEWFREYADWFQLGQVDGEAIRITRAQGEAFRQRRREEPSGPSEIRAPESGLIPVPGGLEATLRPYQQEGFSWLAGLWDAGLGGCLADDMGLGKTVQTIALLLHIRGWLRPEPLAAESAGQLDLFAAAPASDELSPLGVLIIAPSSLLFNWQSELQRFAPGLQVLIHSGPERARSPEPLRRADVLITSYALLVRDIELLEGLHLRCAVLDESQFVKNRDSKTFQCVHRLRTRARYTLTGTPVENSLGDLWSQMQCINPGLLGAYARFRELYLHPIERGGDQEKMEALRQLVRPFLLRRRKEDVARDLPPLSEQIVWCDMTEEQAALYAAERAEVRALLLRQIGGGDAAGAPVVLNALMRLRQIANHPALLPEFAGMSSGKAETICAELATIEQAGHRGLLFSAFLRHLSVYREWLESRGIPYDTLTGEDNRQAKKQAEDALQAEKIRFLLLTLKAGGAGLNLTAADYVLLADPWWNPAVERQAIARAHRIGQSRPVMALRFITRGTIEEKILRLQQRKQQWSDDLLEEADFLRRLSPDELGELVE
jgi:superfamily II DNA or RNA helicase